MKKAVQPNAALNEKQVLILQFMRLYATKFLVQPTNREIAEHVYLDVSQVKKHLGVMVRKGWLVVQRDNRGFRFTVNED